MQIHELNSFSGTPASTDYLAVDDGVETLKIPATAVGVNTTMTVAEAEAGTSTEKRVVTPSVFKSAVESLAEPIAEATAQTVAESVVDSAKVLKVTATLSSLPTTISDTNITADMEVIHSVLGTPSAQTGDWTVTTSSGSAVISGTISGSTTITLYLVEPK